MRSKRLPSQLFSLSAAMPLMVLLSLPSVLGAQKFYPDDPLEKMPPPMNVEDARFRKLNDYVDLFQNILAEPGERQPSPKQLRRDSSVQLIPAKSANTLGEVPDSAWFTNRIGSRPMTVQDVVRGPGSNGPPSADGQWTVVSAKTEGVTPGFRIVDSAGRAYLLKFDPAGHAEMATGADVIGATFFHALGYNVPENYLVSVDPDRLVIGEGTTVTDIEGNKRPMTHGDVVLSLLNVPRDKRGFFRAVASRLIPGKILGEFRFYGTRSDDPNDIIDHEHRRELRGYFVFCAWLNHSDSRAINTLDSLVEENGVKFIKHYLIDFGSILGSASVVSNSARDGNAYLWEFKPALAQIFTLGLYTPRWMRADFEKSPALGMIQYPDSDPERFKPNYPSPAFENRLPDDEYWAAKKVMAFSNEQIAAAVKLAQYSNPADTERLTKYLIGRRDKIGRIYFAKVLPLDNFRVEDRQLQFEDLAAKYNFRAAGEHTADWSSFDNSSGAHTTIAGATSFQLPEPAHNAAAGSYFAAKISGKDAAKTVTVYLRKEQNQFKVVGIDRTW